MESAGFIVNIDKSKWEPCHSIEWLGFQIDLAKGESSVPAKKINMLKSQLLEVKGVQLVPARKLVSLICKIVSMSIGLGPVTRLMTKALYATLNQKVAWCQNIALSPQASQELDFWINEISHFNGQNIWPKPSAVRVVYSDASASGYGGYIVEHGNLIANGAWSDEAIQSSTWRELRSIKVVLQSFQTKLRNERVHWFTDNQNVARIVHHGSIKPALQAEALAIFSLCVNNYI